MAGHRIGRLPVLMLIFTLSMAGFSCRIGAQDIPVIRTVTANTGPGFLTESKFYLAYRPSFPVRNPARSLQDVIDHSDRYEKQISAMFDGKNVDPRIFLWAVYACDSGNTNLAPTASALGQLCAGRFDQARETLLAALRKNPDDYAATLLLGLLSIRDRNLFGYLEKAYRQSPQKTVKLVDFLACNIEFDVPPQSEWDFLDAWINLFSGSPELFRSPDFSAIELHRLREMIRQKYFAQQPGTEQKNDSAEKAALRRFQASLDEQLGKQVTKQFRERIGSAGASVVLPGHLANGRFFFNLMQPETRKKNLQTLDELLSPDRPVPPLEALAELPVWGGIYAAQVGSSPIPEGIEPESVAALFGQLCAKQFDAARKTGLQLLEKQPEDFRVLVLLAALAAEDTALLPHLEQAFTRSPLKTIYVIDFLSRSGILAVSPDSVFFERFTALIYRNREELRQKKIARHVAARLRNIIARNGKMLSKEMRELCYILDHDTNDGPPSYLPQQFRQ